MEITIDEALYKNVDSKDKARWGKIINAWLSSGESQTQFCRRHGLNKNTLSYWRGKYLAAEKGVQQTPTFVPLQVRSSKKPMSAETTTKLQIKTPRGYVIQVPLSMEMSRLQVVLTWLGVIDVQVTPRQ